VVDVTVQLFAEARRRVGRPAVSLSLPDGATVADLRAGLAARYPELLPLAPALLIAVDSRYAGDGEPLPPGAELAAFPPVSGGAGSGGSDGGFPR
jgi:molybdopterin converting factor small subunit